MSTENNSGRKAKGLNGYEQTIFSKRLKALHENTNEKQADSAAKLGVSRQTFNSWLNAATEPDFSTLIRIAKYYNTSVDYLLGLSDIQSLSADIQTSCNTTGLSEAAVEKLALWAAADDRRKKWAEYVSFYITSPDYENALGYLSTAHGAFRAWQKALKSNDTDSAEQLTDNVISQLWHISKLIEKATEKLVEEV